MRWCQIVVRAGDGWSSREGLGHRGEARPNLSELSLVGFFLSPLSLEKLLLLQGGESQLFTLSLLLLSVVGEALSFLNLGLASDSGHLCLLLDRPQRLCGLESDSCCTGGREQECEAAWSDEGAAGSA